MAKLNLQIHIFNTYLNTMYILHLTKQTQPWPKEAYSLLEERSVVMAPIVW